MAIFTTYHIFIVMRTDAIVQEQWGKASHYNSKTSIQKCISNTKKNVSGEI